MLDRESGYQTHVPVLPERFSSGRDGASWLYSAHIRARYVWEVVSIAIPRHASPVVCSRSAQVLGTQGWVRSELNLS